MNALKTNNKEIWLIGSGDHHVVIPVMPAVRFIESYFGSLHTQEILRGCAVNIMRINGEKILNRNFLSWQPWSKKLTQCIFKQAKPLDGLGLEFNSKTTSRVFKIIESGAASIVITVDTTIDNELLCLANKYMGIKDATLVRDNIQPCYITPSYHNYIAPGIIGEIESNPTPTPLSNAEHVNVGKIISELI